MFAGIVSGLSQNEPWSLGNSRYSSPVLLCNIVSLLVDQEPGTRPIIRCSIVHFRHVNDDWSIMCAPNGFICAGSVVWLLVHLNSHWGASYVQVHNWIRIKYIWARSYQPGTLQSPATLHLRSLEVKSCTRLLLGGVLTQMPEEDTKQERMIS